MPDDQFPFELVIFLLVFAFPILLLIFSWVVGGITESRHFASIREREKALRHLPAVPIRTPDSDRVILETRLVTGSVVIANDHFKRMLAGLRMVFGGRLQSYESLIDRARREAILRMKEDWPEASAILNFRIETSVISNSEGEGAASSFEVLAYGTAVRYQ